MTRLRAPETAIGRTSKLAHQGIKDELNLYGASLRALSDRASLTHTAAEAVTVSVKNLDDGLSGRLR
jgi:hypothetical protein